MSGRRAHVRYEMLQPPVGVLRVMRDVVLQRVDHHEVIAISREPGVLGERVTVELPVEEASPGMQTKVVESEPVMVGGVLRYRLRLAAAGAAS